MLSKVSRHTHNYIYIFEFVMHTPLYNHIMIIRSELRSASARESTFFVSRPKNVCELISFTPHSKTKTKKRKKRNQTTHSQLTSHKQHAPCCVRHSRKN